MFARVRSRITYANVVATIALFVALGGSAIAAGVFDGHRIKGRTIPGTKLIRNSVTRNEVKESTLGKVPNADKLDSLDSKDFLRTDGKAADTNKFGGHEFDEFLRKDSAGRAFDASRLEGLPGTSYRLTCPPSDRPARLFYSLCIESTDRAAATFSVASTACADLGGRLPTIAELESFRQQGNITLGSTGGGIVPEWSADPLDVTGPGHWWGIKDDGTLVSVAADTSVPFRCVYTPSG
jgi:hypothetical protein